MIEKKLREKRKVMDLLKKYRDQLDELEVFKSLNFPVLVKFEELQAGIEETEEEIRAVVEAEGEKEGYGIKAYIQERKSVNYDPEKFVTQFPKFKDLVTETIINKDKIKGLVKGKLLTEDEIKDCEIVKVTKAFYLKVE